MLIKTKASYCSQVSILLHSIANDFVLVIVPFNLEVELCWCEYTSGAIFGRNGSRVEN